MPNMALLGFGSYKCKILELYGVEMLLKPHIHFGGNWNIIWLRGFLKEWNEPQTNPEII